MKLWSLSHTIRIFTHLYWLHRHNPKYRQPPSPLPASSIPRIMELLKTPGTVVFKRNLNNSTISRASPTQEDAGCRGNDFVKKLLRFFADRINSTFRLVLGLLREKRVIDMSDPLKFRLCSYHGFPSNKLRQDSESFWL